MVDARSGAPDRTVAPTPAVLTQFLGPVRGRLRTETGSAAVLLTATVVALAWANSPWAATYSAFWHTELALRVAGAELSLDLQHWVNDGLMVFFFFVLGLEVKRELVMGELTDPRRAAVPLVAALTGLAVPALIYLAFNAGGPAASAWGVVISTDTAFLVGVLALVGPASPTQLRLFLITLAVADDVGALTIIALVYSEDLALGPLALAAVGIAAMLGLRRLGVWRGPPYLLLGVAVWLATYVSGVHPTIAGVVIALFTPVYPARRDEVAEAERLTRAFRQSPNPDYARAARLSLERAVSGGERLGVLFRPWSSYLILPIFALANAGVTLDPEAVQAALGSPVTLGVIAGLVVGKLAGISVGVAGAVGSRLGSLAPGLRPARVVGGAALSGIGFTLSLFIVDLALTDPVLADQARIGVLIASVLAALLGWVIFRVGDRLGSADGVERPEILDPPVDPERDHIRGPVDAPLTLVEFGDFECPFCGRATGTVDELRTRFGDRLRYVFRHMPLSDVHPHARLAAEAAEAAHAQDRFWAMHDRLFAHQDALTAAELPEHAAAVGLDVARFTRDLGDAAHARRIRDDLASAEASGADATPTFFIGNRRHTGQNDAATLETALLATLHHTRLDELFEQPTHQAATPTLGPRRGDVPHGAPADGPPLPTDVPETPDRDGAYPRLEADAVALLERHGTRRAISTGEVLFSEGDPGYDFFVVLRGTVAIVEDLGLSSQQVVAVSGTGRFLGELGLLGAEPVYLSAVVTQPGEVLVLNSPQLQSAFADDPTLHELVLRTFLIRRSQLLALANEPNPRPDESDRGQTGP